MEKNLDEPFLKTNKTLVTTKLICRYPKIITNVSLSKAKVAKLENFNFINIIKGIN